MLSGHFCIAVLLGFLSFELKYHVVWTPFLSVSYVLILNFNNNFRKREFLIPCMSEQSFLTLALESLAGFPPPRMAACSYFMDTMRKSNRFKKKIFLCFLNNFYGQYFCFFSCCFAFVPLVFLKIW